MRSILRASDDSCIFTGATLPPPLPLHTTTTTTTASEDNNTTTTTSNGISSKKFTSSNNTANNNSTLGQSIVSYRFRFKEHIKRLIVLLSEYLDDNILDITCDEILNDFILHRIPSYHNYDLFQRENGHNSDLAMTTSTIGNRRRPSNIQPTDRFILINSNNLIYKIIEIEGVQLLALYNSNNNNRLQHMGHPLDHPSEEGYNSDLQEKGHNGHNYDLSHNSNANNDDEEEGSDNNSIGSDDYSNNDNNSSSSSSIDIKYDLLLPSRLSPIISFLHTYFTSLPSSKGKGHNSDPSGGSGAASGCISSSGNESSSVVSSNSGGDEGRSGHNSDPIKGANTSNSSGSSNSSSSVLVSTVIDCMTPFRLFPDEVSVYSVYCIICMWFIYCI